MLISMTGFGTANFENDELIVVAEIKTLNSKFLDLNFRLPRNFPAEKEMELRNLLKDRLERGKVSAVLDFQYKSSANLAVNINRDIFKAYYQRLKSLADEVGSGDEDVFRVVSLMPDVMTQEIRREDSDGKDWAIIKQTFTQALDKCHSFRLDEGKALAVSFVDCTRAIESRLHRIKEYDPNRIENIRERIKSRMIELQNNDMFDKNRFEQEMIYYIEKLDITEEKVRLQNHLDYFLETLQSAEGNGRKLNFISQEMGREINTIGSKANDAEVQRLVVEMKEELEKIKEQSLNIL
ncbi:MAG: YicC family protein [Microscillaceae bacterium]|jgi:uncharacterized protein (TIGR00255 family)|nr:YicC family protein [Microscillaceae bacterium]